MRIQWAEAARRQEWNTSCNKKNKQVCAAHNSALAAVVRVRGGAAVPIIDLRYRPNTRETMSSFLTNPVYADYVRLTRFAERQVKPLDDCVAELRALGVVTAVISGRDIESTFRTNSTNAAVLGMIQAYPDLFVGYYGYDPYKGMAGYRAFKHAIEHDGFAGASIEPGMSRCSICDEKFYPLYALCCDYDVPVIITAGLAPDLRGTALEHSNPCAADRVARDFPELRMLLSHGGYPWVNETLGVCMRHRNVYLDLSCAFGKPLSDCYQKAANEYLADKILFSSASPIVSVEAAIGQYRGILSSAEASEKIFYSNAIRFLKRV